MNAQTEAALSEYSVETGVVRELHDVPPYRVYEVRFGERRGVLKIDDHPRGHAADEGRVHGYVETNTSAPVPEVLAVGDDHYVTAWCDELVDSPERVEPAWTRAAGAWLGTLHGDTAGEFDGFGRLRDDAGTLELSLHQDWIDAARERIAYHRPFLAIHGYAEVADAVREFLRDHPSVFDGVGEPVLCHGDVHPEHHVRTGEGRVVGIDFEHALVAPAEYDYWRTAVPYLEPRESGDELTRAFRDGYETVRRLPDGFEERRPLYLLVNSVAFLESLFLQRTVGPARREEMGEWIQDRVFETREERRGPSEGRSP